MSDELTFVRYLWAMRWKRAARVYATRLNENERKWFDSFVISRHVRSQNAKAIVLNNGHVMTR